MSTNNPVEIKFSIITVTLNDKNGLSETFNSIISQGFDLSFIEWIVVDGFSIDSTQEFLSNINSIPHYNWTSEKDAGIYDAMNKGIKKATGKYLIFMNSGDTFYNKEVLSHVGRVIESSPIVDFIYGDSFEKDSSGKLFQKKARSHKYIFYGMFTHHQAMFYRNVHPKFFYNNSFKIAGDYDYTAKFIKRYRNIMRVDFPICIFQQGGISMRDTQLASEEQKLVWINVMALPILCQFFIRITQRAFMTIKIRIPVLYKIIRFKKNYINK